MGKKLANLITFMLTIIITITLISQILIMRDIGGILNNIAIDISIVKTIIDVLDLYDNLVFMFKVFLVFFGIMTLENIVLFLFKYKSRNKLVNILTDIVNIIYIFMAFRLNGELSKSLAEFKNKNLLENFNNISNFDFAGTKEKVQTLVIILVMAIVLNILRIILNTIRKKYINED